MGRGDKSASSDLWWSVIFLLEDYVKNIFTDTILGPWGFWSFEIKCLVLDIGRYSCFNQGRSAITWVGFQVIMLWKELFVLELRKFLT